jgi:hypothetical protein
MISITPVGAIQLLQCQQSIKIFQVCISNASYNTSVPAFDASTFATFTVLPLANITDLEVRVQHNCLNTYSFSRALISNALKLKRLKISAGKNGRRVDSNVGALNAFQSVNSNVPMVKSLNLKSLALYGLDFDFATQNTLGTYVNLSSLHHLKIHDCKNIVPVFSALTSSLARKSCLIELDMVASTKKHTDIKALEILLDRFSKLTHLRLDVDRARMIDAYSLS